MKKREVELRSSLRQPPSSIRICCALQIKTLLVISLLESVVLGDLPTINGLLLLKLVLDQR